MQQHSGAHSRRHHCPTINDKGTSFSYHVNNASLSKTIFFAMIIKKTIVHFGSPLFHPFRRASSKPLSIFFAPRYFLVGLCTYSCDWLRLIKQVNLYLYRAPQRGAVFFFADLQHICNKCKKNPKYEVIFLRQTATKQRKGQNMSLSVFIILLTN